MQKPWGGTQPGGFAGPLDGWCDWSRGRRGKEFGSPQGYWEAIAEFRAGEGYDGNLCPSAGPGREGCLEAGKGLRAEILPKETWRKISSPVPLFFWFLTLVEKLEERAWRVDSCAWVSRVLVPTAHLIVGTSPTEPVLSSCLETPV